MQKRYQRKTPREGAPGTEGPEDSHPSQALDRFSESNEHTRPGESGHDAESSGHARPGESGHGAERNEHTRPEATDDDAQRQDQGPARLPFNDFKHPPTRPEIDQLLGILPAAELKRFEHRLELMEPRINWALQWYENETGWGYRASYRARVLCVLHFYRGFFTVTLSIPIDDEKRYRSLRELTPGLRKAFEHFTLSTKMKWVTFHVRTRAEVDALLALLLLKFEDLKRKTSRD